MTQYKEYDYYEYQKRMKLAYFEKQFHPSIVVMKFVDYIYV